MKTLTGYVYYHDSLEEAGGVTYFMARGEEENNKFLGVMGSPEGFQGRRDTGGNVHLFPLTAENARGLRARLPWLRPQPLGLQPSVGFGDYMGLATPGHVRAMRGILDRGAAVAPVFAQQSVRENTRTRRSPQQVLDDAMWGLFQTGWRAPWGADADNLKNPADIDPFFEAGFTFFTIDCGEHIDQQSDGNALDTLKRKVGDLPWAALQSTPEDAYRRYLDRSFDVDPFVLHFDEPVLLKALAKYGWAISHTRAMAGRLNELAGSQAYDLEVSVDQSETPTTPEEHFLIASELKRLGVRWVSLAPRFTGRFEKGIDFAGDLGQFEADFARHAAVTRHFGSYRLSLHSGSDKFTIYPIAARLTGGLLHLKTAGTSYLEALRVIARLEPALFGKILQLALERYETDRTGYKVSAALEQVTSMLAKHIHELPALLDQSDVRQVFRVTYGAVLNRFGPVIQETLRAFENEYYNSLADHFTRHLLPLVRLPGQV